MILYKEQIPILLPNKKLQKPNTSAYIRQTFSLTQEVSDKVDELLVKSKVARANRSIIIKTAIQQLGLLCDEALNQAVLETMGKNEI